MLRRGFSLIELAIVLVVVGLMAVFAVQLLSNDSSDDCHARTEAQLKTIDTALQNFVATHSRLPKPARMGLGSSDPLYGYEAHGSISDPLDAGYATDVPTDVTNAGGVLIGSLPHVTLGLENSYASDCWGSKFTYAVTNALTSGNTTNGYMSNAAGTITLRTHTLADPQLLSSEISYVVLSHGQDKYGATPLSAGNRSPANCNGSSEPKIDRENCNSDTIFFNSTRNTGETDQYFDDVLTFSSKIRSTEPCPAQMVSWMACSGMSTELLHDANDTVANTAPGQTGSVDIHCEDGTLTQSSPTCTPSGPPGTCAAGWSNTYVFTHEGYMGDCTATAAAMGDCTSGTGGTSPSTTGNTTRCADHITGGGTCTVHARECGCLADGVDHTSYGVDGSNPTLCCNGDGDANGICGAGGPPCDNDASDGLTGGQKYCPGVAIFQASGDYVCSGGLWGASYYYSCDSSQCLSGSAYTDLVTSTGSCPTPPDCSNGDTLPMPDCGESSTCICN